jgi:hypothetical protein
VTWFGGSYVLHLLVLVLLLVEALARCYCYVAAVGVSLLQPLRVTAPDSGIWMPQLEKSIVTTRRIVIVLVVVRPLPVVTRSVPSGISSGWAEDSRWAVYQPAPAG